MLMQKWLVLPLPAPSDFCAKTDQAAQPICRSTPYPVMIIRKPTASDQVPVALMHVTVTITCNADQGRKACGSLSRHWL